MIGIADLTAALEALSGKRRVFHVEADFQHALAWVIHERHPSVEVRLERPVPLGDERGHADIWLRSADRATVIELKYWTRSATPALRVEGEEFSLRDQGAQPLSRYDFWKDVRRIERLILEGHVTSGYAVALTNVQNYWNAGRAGTIDEGLRIHDTHEVRGSLALSSEASPGTTRGREDPIDLSGSYVTRWRDYSQPAPGLAGGKFRYLLLDVGAALGTS